MNESEGNIKSLKPCLCGQKQDEHQMLVVEKCDSDGYYIKCDSCGACGPVGYPEVEYDACDYDAYDKANEEAEAKAISLWNELWEGRERLRDEISGLKKGIAMHKDEIARLVEKHTVACPSCDFGSGKRGMDTCGYCEGTGRKSLVDIVRAQCDEAKAELAAATARAEKAEAALELVTKHHSEHQDAEIDFYTRLGLAEEHAEQMQAERDVLAELTTKFAEHYGACEICPANGVTCTESDCENDLLTWAAQEAAKRGVGV